MSIGSGAPGLKIPATASTAEATMPLSFVREPRFDDEELFEAEGFLVIGEDFAFVVERVDFAFAWAGFAFDVAALLAFDLDADVEAVRFFVADFVAVEDLVDFPVDDADFDFDVPAFAVEDFLVAGILFSSPIFEF